MQQSTIDLGIALVLAASTLMALAMVAGAVLRGWRDWLALRHAELGRHSGLEGAPSANARIELADLKERVRKLEAIAAGVDY